MRRRLSGSNTFVDSEIYLNEKVEPLNFELTDEDEDL